jgi:hypothetical protein
VSDVRELNDHEKDNVVELAVHPAMWGWLVDAIRDKGFDVSPPIPSVDDEESGEPRSYFRCITIPPERIKWAEEQLGRVEG